MSFLTRERQEGYLEMIKKIEIERFSLTSSKPFDQVVAAVNAAIGHPDMAEFARINSRSPLFCRAEKRSRERLEQSRTDAVYAA